MTIQNISCDVCMDLMPLVRDDVASLDSTGLVMHHLEECEECRSAMGHSPLVEVNGARILKKLRLNLSWWLLLLILAGVATGMSLRADESFIYNLAIMPMLGAVIYLYGEQKWYIMPSILLVGGFVWQLISLQLTGFTSSLASLILYAFSISLSYCLLCLTGTFVALLLKYAFTK